MRITYSLFSWRPAAEITSPHQVRKFRTHHHKACPHVPRAQHAFELNAVPVHTLRARQSCQVKAWVKARREHGTAGTLDRHCGSSSRRGQRQSAHNLGGDTSSTVVGTMRRSAGGAVTESPALMSVGKLQAGAQPGTSRPDQKRRPTRAKCTETSQLVRRGAATVKHDDLQHGSGRRQRLEAPWKTL